MKHEHLNVLRILWTALVASTLFYLAAIFMLRQNPSHASTATSMLMPAAFAVVAAGLATASLVISRMIANAGLKRLALSVVEMTPHELMLREGKRTRYFSNPDDARLQALGVLRTSFILSMALAEAVALFGFVLLFLGHDLTVGLPFFVVCWALMVSHFPTAAKLERQIEDAYDATLKAPSRGAAP